MVVLKTGTSLAFTAACLTAIAAMPVNAQMTGSYGSTPGVNSPQGYQVNTSPNWSNSGNYAPQPMQSTYQGGMGGGTQVVTNGPQSSPGDGSGDWSARQNVMQSQQYDRLLESNRGFRQARMRKECGPVTDPQLRQQCFASFAQDEPYAGSSSSRRNYNSNYGR
jgi:hypothetical protein